MLLIVKSKVAILSHPAVDCNVSVNIPEILYTLPFHMVLSHAVSIVVSPIFSFKTVREVNTILSHPNSETKVSIYRPDVSW